MARSLRDRQLGLLAILIGLAAFGYLVTLPREADADRTTLELENTGQLEVAPRAGARAPDFTLSSLAGEPVNLASLRGRPVLINFWATWCEPCKLEMPFLEERHRRYQERGLAVLAVDFDEPAEAVAAFRDELGLTFELLLDPGGRVQRLYQVRGYPSSYFIDEAGVIRVVQIGVMTEGQLDRHLAELGLGSGSAPER